MLEAVMRKVLVPALALLCLAAAGAACAADTAAARGKQLMEASSPAAIAMAGSPRGEPVASRSRAALLATRRSPPTRRTSRRMRRPARRWTDAQLAKAIREASAPMAG
jgi:hypothetical protein